MGRQSSPAPGVAFRGLNVFGQHSSDTVQQSDTSYLLAFPRKLLQLLQWRSTPRSHILHGFNGLVQHGEMVLVLGRPGSGCSTLLKTLAGDMPGLHADKASKVLYDGSPLTHKQLRGHAIYLAELDVHFPELALGQTLEFALELQRSNHDAKSNPNMTAHDIASKFKLEAAYYTKVGNAMIRGLSGGEKRRTSIAEVFISQSQLQCWDNSTRGLDSSTALSLVRILRRSTTETQATVLMSIYQASNSIYECFDRVMVLYEGYQIYYGPVADAVAYFVDMGFEKPPRATSADFLTSVTNPAERRIRDGYQNRVPRSAEEFNEAWSRSDIAKALLDQIQITEETIRDSRKLHSSLNSRRTYDVSTRTQIALCIRRGFQRLRNHPGPQLGSVIGNTIIAIVVGSVYYNLSDDTAGMDKRAVLLFFSLMINAYAPAFDVLLMWAQRPIVEKHHRYAFYQPFTESIASYICDLPNKLATAVMFNVTLYFMTSLRRSASAFFTYLLIMVVTILTMSMYFRTVGSLSRTHEQSMVPSSMLILLFSAYTGYIIPAKDMVPWLAWFRRLNPVAYAYESLIINEFGSRHFPCSQMIPLSGSRADNMQHQTCAVIGAQPGQIDIDGSAYIERKYSYVGSHLWRNFGILLVMFVILGATHLVATEMIPAQRSRGEVLIHRRRVNHRRFKGGDEESGTTQTGRGMVLSHNFDDEKSCAGLQENGNYVLAQSELISSDDAAVFHWSNLSYSIQVGKRSRQILHDVEGWVRPRSLTALMGVTGAGKTTLLDVLAQRVTVGHISGDVYFGDEAPDVFFQRKVGYVQQDDIHLPTATVREALEFSIRLRRPDYSSVDGPQQVDDVLDLLEMTSYADAIVGVPGEGLNVEQRKRLSIAVEMVAKPELLLFLDEPTSGLDSQTAWSIIMLLRKLANSGQAILVTIHQPSSQLFALFDRLLLLNPEGKVAYFGEVGQDAMTVIKYFERNSAAHCDVSQNPAEWILDVSSKDVTPDGRVTNWHECWVQSQERESVMDQIANLKKHRASAPDSNSTPRDSYYAASFTTQLRLVTRRMFQDYWRDRVYLYCKLTLCVVTTLLNGLSFLNARLDIQGITNIFFSVFLFTQLFSTIDQQVIPRLVDGRSIFEAREKRSKTYSWTVFLTANILVELFWQTIASVLVFITWYYPTGVWRNEDPSFPGSERSGLAFGMIWLFCLWISTFSQVVAVGMTHAETAVQIATLFFWLSLVFCGVLVTPGNLPQFWHFVYRASPLTYFIDGTVVASLANTKITCSDVEILHINPPVGLTCNTYMEGWIGMAGGYLRNPSATQNCEYCQLSDTNVLLTEFGVHVPDRWHNFAYLTVYVVFNILATFAIYWVARERKTTKSDISRAKGLESNEKTK
ncbi:uncharacterized protein BDR25DRAFT_274341 [Lindgomyces ingoldianus]|uniref:Uncharacterized protein n=1 Tax=Lindgomyces ingoldianus TaxID=673940 RepID=A0ACB6Q6W0_9PLEO|nr:uncharacterized protein BDR25DRAFT_274341 [Lindgomyces ingoldianus]KAF2462559.1 hypothetical protein BDR25DRAFT_274341 [Lindgomyces ingoldianus]